MSCPREGEEAGSPAQTLKTKQTDRQDEFAQARQPKALCVCDLNAV